MKTRRRMRLDQRGSGRTCVCIDKTAGNAAARTAMMTRRGRSTPTVRVLGRTQLSGGPNSQGIAEW